MIFEKVKEVLVRQLKIKDASKITLESDIIADFGADSIDVIEMLMELEEDYSITVPSEQAFGLQKVGDLVAFIEKATS